MYRISFEVVVEDPDDAYRLQDHLRNSGMHVERYNMEAIHDGIQHVHTMDGNVMAVPDRPGNHQRNYNHTTQAMIEEYARGIRNDDQLRDLLRSESRATRDPEPDPEDFLKEKDMEL